MPDLSSAKLTTPDLVLLSLLAEHPMHGYEANALLESRHVRDWAGVSRPQVYYSLEKLAGLRLIRDSMSEDDGKNPGPKPGPDRRVFATTSRGRAALAAALERDDWATQLDRPPFLTWLALSWQARPGVAAAQLARRKHFLKEKLKEKKSTLDDVLREVGHLHHEAVWMLKLTLRQLQTELTWLADVERQLPRRARAKHSPTPAR
ncbi:MAG TPA: PadR family transcriptional regulator [Terracidiphilus sp.]|jgi:DNA-binding PadR family transcriptional regulator|nr:PadR family transcriptional regulator [Terracidiphilus sp.]